MAEQMNNLANALTSITVTTVTVAPSPTNANGNSSENSSSAVQTSDIRSSTISSAGSRANSSIHYGFAVTTAPSPSSGAHQNVNGADISSSGLSSSAKEVVICTTTIGGTLILALLVYALWRRRKGASYADIVRFRPLSSTATLSPFPEHERLTALPIYRHKRFSIRSSRHPSAANLHRQPNRKAAVPSPLRTQYRPESPFMNSAWKRSNPPKTPTKNGEWRTFLHDASPEQSVEAPERAYTRTSTASTMTTPILGPSRHSKDTGHSVRESAQDDLGAAPHSPLESPLSPREMQDRWSWTNSQAPSTPRVTAPNTRSSLTSTRMNTVASWVRGHRKASIAEQRPSTSSGKPRSRPLLKNQALQPVLGPPPVSKRLSKNGKNGHVGSISSIFRSSTPDARSHTNTERPLSSRWEEHRSSASTNIEMSQAQKV